MPALPLLKELRKLKRFGLVPTPPLMMEAGKLPLRKLKRLR